MNKGNCNNHDKWISVKDALPDKDGTYLVFEQSKYGNSNNVRSFTFNLEEVDDLCFEDKDRAGWFDYSCELGLYEVNDVTHWMPLPEPPEL